MFGTTKRYIVTANGPKGETKRIRITACNPGAALNLSVGYLGGAWCPVSAELVG